MSMNNNGQEYRLYQQNNYFSHLSPCPRYDERTSYLAAEPPYVELDARPFKLPELEEFKANMSSCKYDAEEETGTKILMDQDEDSNSLSSINESKNLRPDEARSHGFEEDPAGNYLDNCTPMSGEVTNQDLELSPSAMGEHIVLNHSSQISQIPTNNYGFRFYVYIFSNTVEPLATTQVMWRMNMTKADSLLFRIEYPNLWILILNFL